MTTKRKFDTIRSSLLEQLEESKQRALRLEKDKRSLNLIPIQDESDAAIVHENDSVIDRIDEIDRMKITQIEEALDRIEKGEYGECQECGGPISEKRLEAIPFALECIRCANLSEKTKE